MNLKDKLSRYDSLLKSSGAAPTKKAVPSFSAECEHIRTTYPPHHRHGLVKMDSLGGRFQNAPKMLIQASSGNTPELEGVAFVDTETTGLSGGTGTCAFLVGIGYRTSGGFVVDQFLMNDFPAEPDMLHKVSEMLERFDLIVSYNGRAFDIPILEGRFLLNSIPVKLSNKPHLDMLHVVRRIWKHRLNSCSLKSVEEHVLDHVRTDDIEGWLIPQTFFEYLRSGNRDLLEPVVHHNRLDILSLACLAHLVFRAVDDPHRAPLFQGPDWFGLGTLFEKHRRLAEATYCFDRAVEFGLPDHMRPRCLRSLSLAHKRKGDWEEAVRLWNESAVNDDANILFALEELAKFYEHQQRDLILARQTCHRAMTILEIKEATSGGDLTHVFEDFEYRLRRIEKKILRGKKA